MTIFRSSDEIRQVTDMPSNVQIAIDQSVVKASPDYKVKDEGLRVDARLFRIVWTYASQNPDWVFETRYNTFFDAQPITEFRVRKGDETLGSFGIDRTGKYHVTTRKIQEELQRGRKRETKDEARAFKLVGTMYPKTLYEQAKEEMSRTTHCIGTADRYAESCERRSYEALAKYIKPYIQSNLAQFIEVAVSNGMQANEVEQMNKDIDNLNIIRPIHNAQKEDKGVFVLIVGDVYVVSVNSPDVAAPHTVYSDSDKLPDYIKRGVGMLKLVEDNQLVAGIGYRMNSTRFFVLKELNV